MYTNLINIGDIRASSFLDSTVKDSSDGIAESWKSDYIKRIKGKTGSSKLVFTYTDAVSRGQDYSSDFDRVMISYHRFISSNPLKDNDYYKYFNAYSQGVVLDEKYFKYDLRKLHSYYAKFDKDPNYNPFNIHNYRSYVLFMMLKLYGVYESGFDKYFNVKIKGSREYTPITRVPSVLRAELPMSVIEYDIVRAYPTFIDMQLEIKDRKEDIYDFKNKKTINTLFNMHSKVPGATIEKVREQLRPFYGDKVSEVITELRFNNQGQMFRDLEVYEKEAILDFTETNGINNFVRLHDGVYVLEGTPAHEMKFGILNFAVKKCERPEIINNVSNFYHYDDEGYLITSPALYAKKYQEDNFIRVREEGNDAITIFKDSNKIVSPFNYRTETVTYLSKCINELNRQPLENRIAKESNTSILSGFLLLPSEELKYCLDTRDSFGLPFKNGYFKYTHSEENVETIDYKDVHGFFAPHSIQSHEFNFNQVDKRSVFEEFLGMVSTGKYIGKEILSENEKDRFNKFCCMFGYYCHSYKDPSFSPAAILSDEGADDIGRDGGRGKTLLSKAIGHVRSTLVKGGDEFRPDYIHNFADLTKSVAVYIVDDLPAGFKQDSVYTQITGDISCQRKGSVAQTIGFDESPKFLFTTNWVVRYNKSSSSTNRRFIEYKFSKFFNENNTPKDVFGHRLFDDWDNKEWNRFYNFVYYCVALYFDQGMQPIEYDKAEDNYRAYFNSDAKLEEFERIFNLIKDSPLGFNVSDFLKEYTNYQNPLRNEKFFNHINIKTLMNIYLEHHSIAFDYVTMKRRWIIRKEEDLDF